MREYFNELNKDMTHFKTRDDICTPMELVDLMVSYIPDNYWSNFSNVLDPSAGNGNYPAVLQERVQSNKIHAVEYSEIRYNNLRKVLPDVNACLNNFFDFAEHTKVRFDLVIGNPPFSGSKNKNRSISNSFIEESIDLLNEEGILCFVAPNNWMTYNNNNTTLRKLLNEGSFLIIDNDIKKYFPGVGSSFTVLVWQKGVKHITKVINNYLIKDEQYVDIPTQLPFIPLYISQDIVDLVLEVIKTERNLFDYRCDLHNTTKKDLLRDVKDSEFKYKTIHTPSKTRYASVKQEIFSNYTIIVPLTTYYKPYIEKDTNITQSVGYITFLNELDAVKYLDILNRPLNRVIVHLTRYGNFNNIKVLRHLDFTFKGLTNKQDDEIQKLNSLINY